MRESEHPASTMREHTKEKKRSSFRVVWAVRSANKGMPTAAAEIFWSAIVFRPVASVARAKTSRRSFETLRSNC